MDAEIDEKSIVSPLMNLIFEDHDEIAIKMIVTVPRSFESIPSIHHIVKIFKSELDLLVEKMTSYIQNEANVKFCESFKENETNYKSQVSEDININGQEPNIIPIKKKVENHDYNKRGGYCPICGKFKKALTQHIKKIHSRKNSGNCTECGKYVKHLKQHLKNYHSQKIFMCDICDYRGKNSYSLKAHMARHEEKPTVPCPTCGKIVFECYLHQHNFQYHTEEQQKIVPCSICGKELKKKQLPRHMTSVHATKIKCHLCDFKTRDNYNLKFHLRKVHSIIKD